MPGESDAGDGPRSVFISYGRARPKRTPSGSRLVAGRPILVVRARRQASDSPPTWQQQEGEVEGSSGGRGPLWPLTPSYRRDLYAGTSEYYALYRPPYPTDLLDDLRAQAAVKKNGSHFQSVFRRLCPRLGYKGAIWAIAWPA